MLCLACALALPGIARASDPVAPPDAPGGAAPSLAPSPSPSASPSPSPSPAATPEAAWGSEETPGPSSGERPADEAELALLFPVQESSLGSKSETAVAPSDVGADVTVISGDEIRALGCRTLADVLAIVPASFIGGTRFNDEVGIRGFAPANDPNTRVLLLMDGHVLNDAFQHYSAIDTGFPLDFAIVDRVEVIAGPASSIYGSNAFFGVVNVVTRKPAAGARDAEVAASGGEWGYMRGEASASWGARGGGEVSKGGWTVIASATGRNQDGQPLHYDPVYNGGFAVERGTDFAYDGSASVRVVSDRIAVSLAAFGRTRGLIDEIDAYGAKFGDPHNTIGVRHAVADVTAALWRSSSFSLRSHVYADLVEIRDQVLYEPPPDFHYKSNTQEAGGELVSEWTAGASDLVASAEVSGVRATDTQLLAENALILHMTAQERLRLGAFGHVEAGAYVEDSAAFGARLAPRAALVLHPWWGSTWKLIAARGFRDPSLFERFSGAATPAHEERLDDAEIAGAQRISIPFGARRLPLEVFGSAFYDRLDAMIYRAADFTFHNTGETLDSWGATLGAKVELTHGSMRVDGSWFGQRRYVPGFTFPGGFPGSPAWLAHAVTTGRIGAHVEGGLAVLAVGTRVDRGYRSSLDPYVVVEASLAAVRIARRLDLRVSVSNLFDARYAQPTDDTFKSPTVEGRHRSFFGEARVHF